MSSSLKIAELIAPVGVGFGVDQPERHAEPAMLARLAGEGLAQLHELDGLDGHPASGRSAKPRSASGTSAEAAWLAVVDRCRQAVAADEVAAATLPEPYARYQPERLLDMVVESSVGWSADSPPVVCHGRPTPAAFRIEHGRFVGFADLDSLVVADRHLDLAVAHWGIDRVLGAEAVYGLYEGYGQDPDLVRLDHYLLVAHLLGLVGRDARTDG